MIKTTERKPDPTDYVVTDKELEHMKELHRTAHSTGISKKLSEYDRGRIDALVTVMALMKHRGHWKKGDELTAEYLGWIVHHSHRDRVKGR